MLTKRQLDLLEFIDQRVSEDGYSPSFEEMKDAMRLKSKSGIHRLIKALEERGFLRRLENRARALEVVKLPGRRGRASAGTPAQRRPELQWPSVEGIGDLIVPLMGRIAAGSPIEAISTKEAEIGVPPHLNQWNRRTLCAHRFRRFNDRGRYS